MEIYIRMENGRQIIGIENAVILPTPYRNFSGEKRDRDDGKNRHFAIRIDDEMNAEKLKNFGFNVRYREPEGSWEGYWYLDMVISWAWSDPEVHYISGGTDMEMGVDIIGSLDRKNIDFANIEVTQYHWNVNGNTGVKPYVHKLDVYSNKSRMDEKREAYLKAQQEAEMTYQMPIPALDENDPDNIPFDL